MSGFIKAFIGLLLPIILIAGCAENKSIKVNQNQIEFWKQKITNKSNAPKVFYHLYSSEQYENDKWVTEKPADNEDYFIGEKIIFWTDSTAGSFFEMESSSPSGDWTIFSKNYYGNNKKLNFVFWSMNTTQTLSGALIIERKFTFDKSGVLTRQCESVFEMNSRKPVENPNYSDQEVKYWKTINSLPFFNLIK